MKIMIDWYMDGILNFFVAESFINKFNNICILTGENLHAAFNDKKTSDWVELISIFVDDDKFSKI